MSYSTKVHRDIGGDSITLDPSGKIVFGNVTFSINASGKLVVSGVPVVDPHVEGQLWSNGGALTLSTGEAMIPIASYAAEFQCGKVWQPCTVVGVCGEPNDFRFVIIARGPTEYVDTVAEVRRTAPSLEPFG